MEKSKSKELQWLYLDFQVRKNLNKDEEEELNLLGMDLADALEVNCIDYNGDMDLYYAQAVNLVSHFDFSIVEGIFDNYKSLLENYRVIVYDLCNRSHIINWIKEKKKKRR